MNSSCLFHDFFRPQPICSGLGSDRRMQLTIAKSLAPSAGFPSQAALEKSEHRLNIAVLFTSVPSTLTALKEAANLASSLGARITLLVPQVVPHPLPLESPTVLRDFNEKRFRVIAAESPVETSVHIYLCRDRFQALNGALGPGSIVVLAGRRRWFWPTRDEGLARKLRRAGFEVIFKQTE